jgi:hypothetical protein
MATIKKILSPKKEEAKKSASDALSSFLKTAHHYNDIVPKSQIISTGSLILDCDLKIRSGMVIRLVGKGGEVGKSSQAFVFAENYMKTMPNAKTLFIKAEGRLSEEQKRRSGLTFVTEVDGWETNTVFVVCSNVAEDIFDMINNVLRNGYENGEHICFIIDSMDGLILKDDLEKGIGGGGMVAGVPKLTKLFFRHLALPISHYDALGIMTGQYAAQIKIDTYAPSAPNQGSSSGGSAQQHQSDYVLDYQTVNQSDLILENENEKPHPFNNKIIGKYSRIKIQKSASNVSGQMYSVPIRKGAIGSKQLWVEKEITDLIVAFEIVKKSGSWFSFDEDTVEDARKNNIELKEKVQGLNGISKYLEENQPVYEFFYKKIKGLINCE